MLGTIIVVCKSSSQNLDHARNETRRIGLYFCSLLIAVNPVQFAGRLDNATAILL